LLPRFSDDGHLADPIHAWAIRHDSAVRDRETREVVRRNIDQLPDSYRTVLLLRDIEGHSTDETAQLLGTTPGNVKTRLHRARQALRTLLDRDLQGDGR
jgi:RNA polymerase sigma-70 factor (ECF subfamily)